MEEKSHPATDQLEEQGVESHMIQVDKKENNASSSLPTESIQVEVKEASNSRLVISSVFICNWKLNLYGRE